MDENDGPYETEDDARMVPAVRAIYEASRASSRRGVMDEGNLRMLTEACQAAGVELGAYDHGILSWLANYEPQTCAVIAGIIRRAAQRPEDVVLGYSLAIRYPDGAVRMDPLGSVFKDPAPAVEQRDAAQGHSAARGWDERWAAVRLTEVPGTAEGDSGDG